MSIHQAEYFIFKRIQTNITKYTLVMESQVRKPLNNNIVTLDYIFTNGGDSNGANVFTMVDNIGGYATITVTTLAKADGGTERETSESIRFNAPLNFYFTE